MAWVDATNFFSKVEAEREKQYGPGNPRDFVLCLAAARPPEHAIPDYERICEFCGCGIEKGETLCASCASDRRLEDLRMRRALGDRCIACGGDLADRGPRAVRCEPCAKKHHIKQQEASAKRCKIDKPVGPRVCAELDCETDISDRPNNTRYCEQCAADRQRRRARDYLRARRAMEQQEAVA
jgi:hypothetical protein